MWKLRFTRQNITKLLIHHVQTAALLRKMGIKSLIVGTPQPCFSYQIQQETIIPTSISAHMSLKLYGDVCVLSRACTGSSPTLILRPGTPELTGNLTNMQILKAYLGCTLSGALLMGTSKSSF
jgi:hypothetical protein